jgi:hypothetical protein
MSIQKVKLERNARILIALKLIGSLKISILKLVLSSSGGRNFFNYIRLESRETPHSIAKKCNRKLELKQNISERTRHFKNASRRANKVGFANRRY